MSCERDELLILCNSNMDTRPVAVTVLRTCCSMLVQRMHIFSSCPLYGQVVCSCCSRANLLVYKDSFAFVSSSEHSSALLTACS